MLLDTYRETGKVPERMLPRSTMPADIERKLAEVASAAGAVYVPVTPILCNTKGCLTRVGNEAKDIITWDATHFTDEGSRYFVRQIQSKIFD